MPITGLVVTLSGSDTEAAAALDALARRPELSLGEPVGARVPLSTDTRTLQEDGEIQEWLAALPGVRFVDVVWAWIEDELETAAVAEPGMAVEQDRAEPSR